MRRWLATIIVVLASAGSAQAAHSVVLTWTASTDAQTGLTYNMYRALGTIGSGNTVTCPAAGTPALAGWTQITGGIQNGTLTYTDNGPVVGNGYCYYATASLGGLESVPSNVATAIITPAPPTSLTEVTH